MSSTRSSLHHCHFARPLQAGARACAPPLAGALEGSAVFRALQTVSFQLCPTPGVSQARRPPCGPLTWHSKPSRPWWFSAPSPEATRPRCPCRRGPHSAGLPWRQRRRSVTHLHGLPLPRLGAQELTPSSTERRACREPKRSRLRTAPPRAAQSTQQL